VASVSRIGAIYTSIVGKAAVAVVAFALALTAVAWVAIRATDDATNGAAAVEREFAMPRCTSRRPTTASRETACARAMP
jgi:hypothetical protein